MRLAEVVETNGLVLVDGLLDSKQISTLQTSFESATVVRSLRNDDVFGARNILVIPEIAGLANAGELLNIISDVIGPQPKCVRGLFFDKTPGANWPVAWHQDLSLAVKRRIELSGWENWSVKAGVDHVQPPPAILERMVTLRLHLDECDADNGPLKVLPGTHRRGRIPPSEIAALRGQIVEHVCTASVGSGLLMRPLLLHASSAARKPRRRRVIHLEFAPSNLLPVSLEWA